MLVLNETLALCAFLQSVKPLLVAMRALHAAIGFVDDHTLGAHPLLEVAQDGAAHAVIFDDATACKLRALRLKLRLNHRDDTGARTADVYEVRQNFAQTNERYINDDNVWCDGWHKIANVGFFVQLNAWVATQAGVELLRPHVHRIHHARTMLQCIVSKAAGAAANIKHDSIIKRNIKPLRDAG